MNTDWINVANLKTFLDVPSDNNPSSALLPHKAFPIKIEPSSDIDPPIKEEPRGQSPQEHTGFGYPIKTRTLKAATHDIIEILSSEDEDDDKRREKGKEVKDEDWDQVFLPREDSRPRWESEPISDWDLPKRQDESVSDSDSDIDEPAETFNPNRFITISDTDWHDSDISSTIIKRRTQITSEVGVDHVEYLTEIPSLWPIPCIPTAFVVDLRDEKYNIYDKEGKIFSPDALIKNKVCCDD